MKISLADATVLEAATRRSTRRRNLAIRVASITVLLLAWEVGGLYTSRIFLTPFHETLLAFVRLGRAGTLLISNAEVIAGVVAQQLLAPGARTFYGSCATTMDLRTGAATCGGPEDLLYQMASAQLARSYGLKSIVGSFATGSKTSDWQAGTENGLSAMCSAISGVDLFSGAGLLYAARVFSPLQMLLDCELFDLIARITEGFDADEDTLATEVIDSVGPGGHFLDQDHTLAHMRELWRSSYFSRESWEDWRAAGKPEPRDRARARAEEILATHEPHPLPGGAAEEIRKVVERSDAALAS